MDYIIEITAWHLGFDEADELVDAICELLEERGYGTDPVAEDANVKAVVALKGMGTNRLDASSSEKAQRVITRAARGARLVAIPGTEFRKAAK